MILLVLISFILIAGYVFAMIKKMKEIPYSISDTYYALTHKFWFTLCMIGSGVLLLPAAFEASTENSQFLVFLSVVGMGCIRGISQFQRKPEKRPLYRCCHVFNLLPDMGRLQFLVLVTVMGWIHRLHGYLHEWALDRQFHL